MTDGVKIIRLIPNKTVIFYIKKLFVFEVFCYAPS